MLHRHRVSAAWVLPLIVLLSVLALFGLDAGGVASALRGRLFDSYQRGHPRQGAATMVRVLEIDDAAIARFGPWPWPRGVLAKLVDSLKAQGAKTVVFTDPITQPDPASPKNLVPLVPPGPQFDAARTALAKMPTPDDALASSFSDIAAITTFTLGEARPAAQLPFKTHIGWSGIYDPSGRLRGYDQALPGLPVIAQASQGVGAANLERDSDGVVRRMPLAFRLGHGIVPSLDAEVLRIGDGKSELTLVSDDGRGGLIHGQPGVRGIVSEKGEIPTSADGSIWIAYSSDGNGRNILASAATDRALPAGTLQDAIVYIGAPDNQVATPRGPMSVAELHAEAAENLLSNSVLRRPRAAAEAELLCLLLFGLGAVVLFARVGVRWAGLFTVVSAGGAYAISRQLFLHDGVLFDSLIFAIGMGTVFLAGAGARFLEYRHGRTLLKTAFADSLPPGVIETIARKPQALQLEGMTRTVSYLSCGVRGFADMAATFRSDPATFTQLMQRVLAPLMEEVRRHGGGIDRLNADGFTAYWNAPLDDGEHAIHACEAANGMMQVIAKVNEIVTQERRSDGVALAPVEIGIGLSLGPAITGTIEAKGRMVYAINGDCVAAAAQIMRISGQYGPAVIVAEDIRKAAERGFAFLEVDTIALIGEEPVKLYAMLGNPVMRASPRFRALATFHEHIFQSMRARQWDKMRELIVQCRKLSGASQKLYDLHLARIAEYEKNPPPPEWDGTWHPRERA